MIRLNEGFIKNHSSVLLIQDSKTFKPLKSSTNKCVILGGKIEAVNNNDEKVETTASKTKKIAVSSTVGGDVISDNKSSMVENVQSSEDTKTSTNGGGGKGGGDISLADEEANPNTIQKGLADDFALPFSNTRKIHPSNSTATTTPTINEVGNESNKTDNNNGSFPAKSNVITNNLKGQTTTTVHEFIPNSNPSNPSNTKSGNKTNSSDKPLPTNFTKITNTLRGQATTTVHISHISLSNALMDFTSDDITSSFLFKYHQQLSKKDKGRKNLPFPSILVKEDDDCIIVQSYR